MEWTHTYDDGFLILAAICQSCSYRKPDAEKDGGPVSIRCGGLCLCCHFAESCWLMPQKMCQKVKASGECMNCDYKGDDAENPALCTPTCLCQHVEAKCSTCLCDADNIFACGKPIPHCDQQGHCCCLSMSCEFPPGEKQPLVCGACDKWFKGGPEGGAAGGAAAKE